MLPFLALRFFNCEMAWPCYACGFLAIEASFKLGLRFPLFVVISFMFKCSPFRGTSMLMGIVEYGVTQLM
jgi:hypothetical protein